MRAPLIHIGYNKTGSTWLQEEFFPLQELGFHLLLEMEDRKQILRYIVKEHALYYDAGRVLSYYQNRVKESGDLLPVLSAERFSGDPHSGGYDSVQIANRLKGLFPDARILIVTREQRSMLLSTYTQYVRAGGTRSLRAYVNPAERGSRRVPQFDFRFFDYAPLVAYYRCLFGEDRVMVLPYEWFKEKPEYFLAKILRFVDLATEERLRLLSSLPFGKRINRSYGAFTLWAKRCYNRFFLDNALHPGAFFPLPEGVEKRAVRLFRAVDACLPEKIEGYFKKRRRVVIEREIGARYAAGNRHLKEMTGLPLEETGYVVG